MFLLSNDVECKCSCLHVWQEAAIYLYRMPAPAKDSVLHGIERLPGDWKNLIERPELY